MPTTLSRLLKNKNRCVRNIRLGTLPLYQLRLSSISLEIKRRLVFISLSLPQRFKVPENRLLGMFHVKGMQEIRQPRDSDMVTSSSTDIKFLEKWNQSFTEHVARLENDKCIQSFGLKTSREKNVWEINDRSGRIIQNGFGETGYKAVVWNRLAQQDRMLLFCDHAKNPQFQKRKFLG
jgi:hypothetical protein